MGSRISSKLHLLRRRSLLATTTTFLHPPPTASQNPCSSSLLYSPNRSLNLGTHGGSFHLTWNHCLSSRPSNLNEVQGPSVIDYGTLLSEDEFHRLVDETIHDLQEKFEVYGDSIQIDGYDVDYGNHVLTLKFGNLGTYVINKQTPNRQIWLSSPVSGPSRFDWDATSKTWFYRRTKATLLHVLEEEIPKLCGQPIVLR